MRMRPGGLVGHSAALIGLQLRQSMRGPAPYLGHAEIEGSDPSPGILLRGVTPSRNPPTPTDIFFQRLYFAVHDAIGDSTFAEVSV